MAAQPEWTTSDYPWRYDFDAVADRFGTTVGDFLWGRGSFYREVVEADLRDVAVQLFVVPGATTPPYEGRIYCEWMDVLGTGTDGYINGLSAGNRAIVANRHDPFDEARLIFHELAHLVLCHDDDPENTGVMGTGREVDLTESEWDRFRDGLANVSDTTGYDFLLRPCLWSENLSVAFE